MKRILIIVLIFLLNFTVCKHHVRDSSNKIYIKGSFTVYMLAREWASVYMELHPGVAVYAEGGGSSLGFNGLLEGSVDIAMASRLIRSDEAKLFADKYNSIGLSFLVAKDALSIYVNHNNPVFNITLEQLRKIFTGEITNWKTVGGLDEPIQVVIRPNTSGTHVYFKEYILENSQYTDEAVILPNHKAIIDYVKSNGSAIGFGALTANGSVKHCRINGVAATEENVRNHMYPISRYLYLYTVNTPTGEVKNFIDWVISPAGQKIVAEVGFVPLWQDERQVN